MEFRLWNGARGIWSRGYGAWSRGLLSVAECEEFGVLSRGICSTIRWVWILPI